MNKLKVCHVTDVHSSDDVRIFHKECSTLAKNGYDVTLIAPGKSYEKNNVKVVGCGKIPNSRIKRMSLYATKTVYIALKQKCDVYHFHDPEMLIYFWIFKLLRKKVIFDSHEDYGFEKTYLPFIFRKLVVKLYLCYERLVAKNLSGLICCYRRTKERLEDVCPNNVMLYNFPIENVGPVTKEVMDESDDFTIGFVGLIDDIWNHETLIKAMEQIQDVKYVLAGSSNETMFEKLGKYSSWNRVEYLGRLPHSEVNDRVYSVSNVGYALLDYIDECYGTEGNMSNTKLFEIMDAGLPVIATDFRLWKEIIEKNDCGVCIPPNNPQKLAQAIDYLKSNPQRCIEMGENAKRAIHEKYNWETDSVNLIKIYENLECKK